MFDIERHGAQFVSLVKHHDILWNKKNINFKNIVMKNAAWNSIGAVFGATGEQASQTFTVLRQKYLREKKKTNGGNTSNAWGKPFKSWCLMGTLKFLDEVIASRKSYSAYMNPNSLSTHASTSSEESNSSLPSIPMPDTIAYSPLDQFDMKYTESPMVINHIIKPEPLEEIPDNTSPPPVDTTETMLSPEPPQIPSFPATSQDCAFSSPPPKKVKRNGKKEDVSFSDLIAAIEAPINITQTVTQEEKWNVQDNVKVFCKYLATRLNKLPETAREEFESNVLNQLFEVEKSVKK